MDLRSLNERGTYDNFRIQILEQTSDVLHATNTTLGRTVQVLNNPLNTSRVHTRDERNVSSHRMFMYCLGIVAAVVVLRLLSAVIYECYGKIQKRKDSDVVIMTIDLHPARLSSGGDNGEDCKITNIMMKI
eukprot:703893_1